MCVHLFIHSFIGLFVLYFLVWRLAEWLYVKNREKCTINKTVALAQSPVKASTILGLKKI